MQLQPPSDPLHGFFAPVHLRHPDVDIVVLPRPERISTMQPMDEGQVDSTLDRVAGAIGRVWEVALHPKQPPTAGLGFGPDDGTVVASARGSITTSDGFGALVALRGALEGAGWRVRRVPGGVERLSAARGEVRVQASYAEATGALLLEVRSDPMYVGRARARELVRR